MSFDDAGTDFDASDRGGFRHEVATGDFTYAELEEKVLAALTDDDEGHASRTLGQIKRHAGLAPGFDLGAILEGMQLDKKIFKRDCGEFTAYYVTGAEVKRAWLDMGKVATEYRESASVPKEAWPEPVEEIETVNTVDGVDITKLEQLAGQHMGMREIARELGLGSSKVLNIWLAKHPEIRAEYDRIRREVGAASEKVWHEQREAERREKNLPIAERVDKITLPEDTKPAIDETREEENDEMTATAAAPAKAETRKYEIPDPAVVEKAAREGKSAKKLAEDLGMNPASLKNYLRGSVKPESGIKGAWDRGKAAYAETLRLKRVDANKRTVGRPPIECDVDADKLEQAAATLKNGVEIGKAMGLGQSLLYDRMKKFPHLRKAFDRGRAKYEASNPVRTKDSVISSKLTPEGVEQAAATHRTKAEVARALGYADLSGLRDVLKRNKDLCEAFDRGRERFLGENPRRSYSRKILIDADLLEAAAASQPSQQAIAEALGISSSLLRKDIGPEGDPNLRKAYDRGRAKYEAENGGTRRGRKPVRAASEQTPAKADKHETKPLTHLGLDREELKELAQEILTDNPADICFQCYADLPAEPIEVHPFDTDERWAFCSENCKNVALAEAAKEEAEIREKWPELARIDGASDNESDAVGADADSYIPAFEGEKVGFANLDPESISTSFREAVAESYDREAERLGREAARAEHTQRELSSVLNGRELMRQEEETLNQIEDLEAGWTKKPVQHRYITFGDGSQAMIAFEGNFFNLKPEERAFMNEIADRFQRYPEGGKPLPFVIAGVIVPQSRPSLWQRIKAVFRG